MKIKEILSGFSEIFNSEKSNIDDIIDVLFKSSKILKELKPQFDHYKKDHIKSVVLYGLTGAGKTTLSHYLEGNELEYRKLEDKSKKLFVSNEKSIGREIGHSSLSTTFFPNVFTIKDLTDHQIIDLAGLWDNNGIFVQIANAWILTQLISQYKTAKFLIVTDSKELDLARGQPFIDKMKDLLGNTIKSDSVFSLIMSHAEEEKVLENEEHEESEKIIKIIETNKSLISEQLSDCLKQNASSLGFFCKPAKLGKYNIPNQLERIIKLIQNTKESKLDNFFEVPISEQQTFINRLNGLGIDNKSFIQILLNQDLDYYVKNNIKKLDFSNLKLTLNSYRESDEIIDILGSIKKSFINQQLSVNSIDYELLLIESLKNISEYFPKGEIEDIIIRHKDQIRSKVNEIDFILNKIMNGDTIIKTVNNKVLTLKAPYITSEQILNYLLEEDQSIKEIKVYSSAVKFNKNMNLPSKNLFIYSNNYKVENSPCVITLSAKNQYEEDGKGVDSGNFILFATKGVNKDYFTIDVDGSNGADGRNGANGSDGQDGMNKNFIPNILYSSNNRDLINTQFGYITDLVVKDTEKLTSEYSFLEKIYKKTEKTSCCGCSIRILSNEYQKLKMSELKSIDLINLSGHEFILSFFVGLSQLGLVKAPEESSECSVVIGLTKYLEEKCAISLQDSNSTFYTLKKNNQKVEEKLITSVLTIHSSFNKSKAGYVLAEDILKYTLDRLDINLPNFISIEYISKLTSRFKLQIVSPQFEKSILGQTGDNGADGTDGKDTGAHGYYVIANDLHLDINKGKDGVPGKGGIGGAGGKNGQNGFVEYCLVAPYTTEEKDYKLDENSECAVLYSVKAKNDDLYKEKFGIVENSKSGFPGNFGDITQNVLGIENMQNIAKEFYCSGEKYIKNDYYNLFHLERDYLTALIGEEHDSFKNIDVID